MRTCPICEADTCYICRPFCAEHAGFAALWSAVMAAKWGDWEHHNRDATPDDKTHVELQSLFIHRPIGGLGWRAEVAAINAGARFWLDGGAHGDNAA